MKKLKIMWLHSQLTSWGGGTRFLLEVIKRMSNNHEISLFLSKSYPDVVDKFSELPIKIETLGKYSTGDIQFWLNFNGQLSSEIEYLKSKSGNFDLVVSSFFPMNVVGNKMGLPHLQYCFEPFAFFWDSFMIKNLPFAKQIFLKLMIVLYGKKDIEATKKSTKILTVNNGVKEWISRIYDRDSTATLLGVDTSFFKKTFDSELAEKYKGKKVIIHSTDWTPLKRTNWLIDQFIEISSEIADVVLVITEVSTHGKERDVAIQKITEKKVTNIELCGFLPLEKLPAYYSIADIGIYCGIGQGASAASLFVLECMACETPVIRTNDTTEEVEHEKNGYLFDKDDIENFKRYVLKLLNEKELQEHYAIAARSMIEERYSWDKVAIIFEKECLTLL